VYYYYTSVSEYNTLQTILKCTYIDDPLSGASELAAAWNLHW